MSTKAPSSPTRVRGIVCSLYCAGNSNMARFPEGVLIWTESLKEVEEFLNRENIQGSCEKVDADFYEKSDCHVCIVSGEATYRTGFIPFWKE